MSRTLFRTRALLDVYGLSAPQHQTPPLSKEGRLAAVVLERYISTFVRTVGSTL
jgi:hypothetical protein